jgi:hypothetical protein
MLSEKLAQSLSGSESQPGAQNECFFLMGCVLDSLPQDADRVEQLMRAAP